MTYTTPTDLSTIIAQETELWEQLMFTLDTDTHDQVTITTVEASVRIQNTPSSDEVRIFPQQEVHSVPHRTIPAASNKPLSNVSAHGKTVRRIGKFDVIFKQPLSKKTEPLSQPVHSEPTPSPETVKPEAKIIVDTKTVHKTDIHHVYDPAAAVIPHHRLRPIPAPQKPTFNHVEPEKPAAAWIHKGLISTGIATMIISLAMLSKAILPTVQAETAYQLSNLKTKITTADSKPIAPLPAAVPLIFDPLVTNAGEQITPVDANFGIVVPKIGINASVIPSVDPDNQKEYNEALLHGVAHAATSFYPNENGVTYIFSHSTNYDWYVKDLNAVFYNLKNLEKGDIIVLLYKGKRYTYQLREKKVVNPNDTSLLSPIYGTKMLVLETCWPPGSTTERLLVIADFIEEAKLEI
jgi:LPXTG-site transpeptidase (sortase) family protein